MSAGLKVIAPGVHSTVQDCGRIGYRAAGVPGSGPLDRIAFTLANALVGNGAHAPALEILSQGPVLEVLASSVRVALVGGTGGLVTERGGAIAPKRTVRFSQGEGFRCGPLGEAGCSYLAVEGGFDVPRMLGSASTYVRSRLGGLHGGALEPGDVLPVHFDRAVERPERGLAAPLAPEFEAPIRVVLGPQHDGFTEDAVAALLSSTYTISAQSDRMGFRLQGRRLAHARGYDLVSDGVVNGSIQVPGSGQPIVVLADGQTTGGYPKIATVISADLPLIGRRRPGASVRFAAVTQGEAEAIRREQERTIARWIGDIHAIPPSPAFDHDVLYSANLVGGVSDGSE